MREDYEALQFKQQVYELAFGDDAYFKDYDDQQVLNRLKSLVENEVECLRENGYAITLFDPSEFRCNLKDLERVMLEAANELIAEHEIDIIDSYLCAACGSNHEVLQVRINKNYKNMCQACIDKETE